MNYKETVDYLYNATPQFQQIGAAAYKPGLDTAISLDNAFGNPHSNYITIHVAGTNGKGSVCHTLAAILQSAGMKVGLFTSPHLVDFRERIRVNGHKITEEAVTEFVAMYLEKKLGLAPSFFELTTIMAFDYFAREGVDVAVIETGLGGRLDTTNIILPALTVITNISFDHKAQLGNTLRQIASEKAGIIKPGIPVVVGNDRGEGVRETFTAKAREMRSPIIFAGERKMFSGVSLKNGLLVYQGTLAATVESELTGDCQRENAATILTAVEQLRTKGMYIPDEAVREGFRHVCSQTGLMGRWMKISDRPLIVCDTGHNEGGWAYLSDSLGRSSGNVHIIVGFVSDKDVETILRMMPRKATYYFTRASVPRAMDQNVLADKAAAAGLEGTAYHSVADALRAARKNAAPDDMIFIGGSTFVVADLLSLPEISVTL